LGRDKLMEKLVLIILNLFYVRMDNDK